VISPVVTRQQPKTLKINKYLKKKVSSQYSLLIRYHPPVGFQAEHLLRSLQVADTEK